MSNKIISYCFAIGLFLFPASIFANEVEIVNAKVSQSSDKSWHFSVTLKHADEGWKHYANEWQITTLDNKILGTRTLYHPHVKEQPFTRSLGGIKIPVEIKTVRIVAKDTIHGLSKKAIELTLANNEITHVLFNPVKKEK